MRMLLRTESRLQEKEDIGRLFMQSRRRLGRSCLKFFISKFLPFFKKKNS